jgi:hypothetical protein
MKTMRWDNIQEDSMGNKVLPEYTSAASLEPNFA